MKHRRRIGALAASACCALLWLAGLVTLAYGSHLLGIAFIVAGGIGVGLVLLAGSKDKQGSAWELIWSVLGELFGRL